MKVATGGIAIQGNLLPHLRPLLKRCLLPSLCPLPLLCLWPPLHLYLHLNLRPLLRRYPLLKLCPLLSLCPLPLLRLWPPLRPCPSSTRWTGHR